MRGSRHQTGKIRVHGRGGGRLGTVPFLSALVGAGLAAGAVVVGLAAATRSPYRQLAAGAWMLAPIPIAAAVAVVVAFALRACQARNRSRAQALALLLAVAAAALGVLLRFADPGAVFDGPRALWASWRPPSSLPPLDLLFFDLTIVALAAAFGLDAVASRLGGAFCFACARRSRSGGEPVERAPLPPEEAFHALRRRDWSFFRRLGPPTTRSGGRLRFVLSSCPCGMTRALRVVLQRGLRRVEIVGEMHLGPDDVRTVRTLAREDDAVPQGREWEVSTSARLVRASGSS